MDKKGYRNTKIDGQTIGVHRLVMFLHTGRWPEEDVDHVNGIKDDNRIDNLRFATRQQNIWNTGARSSNRLGVKNVRQLKDTGKFQVIVNRESYGCYSDLELAELIALEVRDKLHGDFSYVE